MATKTPVIFDPARHCGAKTNPLNGGTPCRQWKGIRTDHVGAGNCWMHFGRSPNGKRHAATDAAREALVSLGIPVQTDPQQALLEQVWEAAGNVAFLRERVQALEVSVAGPDHLGDGRPHVLVVMYGEERDRLSKIAKMALDAGVAAKFVTIAERQADAIVSVINAVLDGLDLDDAQRERGREIAGTKLRLLSGVAV
jgi:hypothetical protein